MGEPIIEHNPGIIKLESPTFGNVVENQLNGSHSSASSVHNDSLAGSNSSTSVPPQNGTPVNPSYTSSKPAATVDYLTQLLKDKKQLAAFPNVFIHLERLVDDEINRVRVQLFQFEFTREPITLPDPVGEVIVKQEKVFIPVKEYPEYNFVGRILGPRGLTSRQLEQETGCKIMVRGKGSMRDKKKEEANRGKPNWEHLNEELHVLIQCEDTPNRVDIKIARAVEEVKKLLVPSPEGEDELKKKQLMELAIINGTFRQGSQNGANKNPLLLDSSAARLLGSPAITSITGTTALRSPALAGAPLIMQPNAATQRLQGLGQNTALLQQLGLAGGNLIPGATSGAAGADYQQLLFSQMQYDPNALALQQQQLAAVLAANGLDYSSAVDPAAGGAMLDQRRFLGQARTHPYPQPSKNKAA